MHHYHYFSCLFKSLFLSVGFSSSDRDLWHSADYFGLKFIDHSLIYEVLRGAKMLRAANASSRVPLLEPIVLKPLRLQYVDLTNTAISKPLLISLLNASQDLRKLSLESLTFCDDDICSSIARNHRLDTLNLCMVTGLTVEGVTRIMQVSTAHAMDRISNISVTLHNSIFCN